ncbi:MAG: ATP-binding domain-containing protein, partial [Reyranellaceae bacterium]
DAHTLGLWLPMLQAKGVLARGAKERIKDGQIPDDAGEVVRLFESQDIAMAAFSGDLGWLCAHVSAEYRDRIAYPVKVAKRRGIDALSAEPRVMVGTIHSFKGGEADRVVVSPDLSPAAHAEHLDDLPSVRRAFYVAMTRTRDRLEILAPSSRRCVDLT